MTFSEPNVVLEFVFEASDPASERVYSGERHEPLLRLRQCSMRDPLHFGDEVSDHFVTANTPRPRLMLTD